MSEVWKGNLGRLLAAARLLFVKERLSKLKCQRLSSAAKAGISAKIESYLHRAQLLREPMVERVYSQSVAAPVNRTVVSEALLLCLMKLRIPVSSPPEACMLFAETVSPFQTISGKQRLQPYRGHFTEFAITREDSKLAKHVNLVNKVCLCEKMHSTPLPVMQPRKTPMTIFQSQHDKPRVQLILHRRTTMGSIGYCVHQRSVLQT